MTDNLELNVISDGSPGSRIFELLDKLMDGINDIKSEIREFKESRSYDHKQFSSRYTENISLTTQLFSSEYYEINKERENLHSDNVSVEGNHSEGYDVTCLVGQGDRKSEKNCKVITSEEIATGVFTDVGMPNPLPFAAICSSVEVKATSLNDNHSSMFFHHFSKECQEVTGQSSQEPLENKRMLNSSKESFASGISAEAGTPQSILWDPDISLPDLPDTFFSSDVTENPLVSHGIMERSNHNFKAINTSRFELGLLRGEFVLHLLLTLDKWVLREDNSRSLMEPYIILFVDREAASIEGDHLKHIFWDLVSASFNFIVAPVIKMMLTLRPRLNPRRIRKRTRQKCYCIFGFEISPGYLKTRGGNVTDSTYPLFMNSVTPCIKRENVNKQRRGRSGADVTYQPRERDKGEGFSMGGIGPGNIREPPLSTSPRW